MKLEETLPKDLEVGDLVPGLGSVVAIRRGIEVEFSAPGYEDPLFHADDETRGYLGVTKPPPPAPKVGDWVHFDGPGCGSGVLEWRLAYISPSGHLISTDATRWKSDGRLLSGRQEFHFEKGADPGFDSFEVVERS